MKPLKKLIAPVLAAGLAIGASVSEASADQKTYEAIQTLFGEKIESVMNAVPDKKTAFRSDLEQADTITKERVIHALNNPNLSPEEIIEAVNNAVNISNKERNQIYLDTANKSLSPDDKNFSDEQRLNKTFEDTANEVLSPEDKAFLDEYLKKQGRK